MLGVTFKHSISLNSLTKPFTEERTVGLTELSAAATENTARAFYQCMTAYTQVLGTVSLCPLSSCPTGGKLALGRSLGTLKTNK